MFSIWQIISHLGTILAFIKQIEVLVAEVVKTKSMPGCSTIDPALAAVEKLFADKVIDIPGVDEQMIADAIQQIRDNLCPKNAAP